MLLVEIPVADPYRSRLQPERLESKGTIKTAGAVVFRINAKLDLKYALITRAGQHT